MAQKPNAQIRDETARASETQIQERKDALERGVPGHVAAALGQRANQQDMALISNRMERNTLEAQITALRDQIPALTAEVTEIRTTLSELVARREKLKVDIADFATEWNVKVATVRRDVAVLEAKRDTLAAENQEFEHNMELQRTDLADRIKAADRRDQTLSSREARNNASNGQLMEL